MIVKIFESIPARHSLQNTRSNRHIFLFRQQQPVDDSLDFFDTFRCLLRITPFIVSRHDPKQDGLTIQHFDIHPAWHDSRYKNEGQLPFSASTVRSESAFDTVLSFAEGSLTGIDIH